MTSKPKTVLIVDDDEGMRDTLTAILKRDFRVLRAATGEAALPMLSREDVDLMLLDVSLPDRPGLDLLSDLRQEPRTRDLPVLVVTALTGPDAKERVLALGASDVVEKPFTRERLLSAVGSALRRDE